MRFTQLLFACFAYLFLPDTSMFYTTSRKSDNVLKCLEPLRSIQSFDPDGVPATVLKNVLTFYGIFPLVESMNRIPLRLCPLRGWTSKLFISQRMASFPVP
uniref:Secreted protein n=1 Tax=Trichobilharzia regenti TaxID=157069 RepID=A0AA85J9V5_TRIRE|nr:unnamed protein product [Trichobilharzia regenti]